MARKPGTPMYGNKTGSKGVQGTYYITREADKKLRAAARRTGKSRSNVIDYCLRASADALTKAAAEAIAAGAGQPQALVSPVASHNATI